MEGKEEEVEEVAAGCEKEGVKDREREESLHSEEKRTHNLTEDKDRRDVNVKGAYS